MLDKHFRIVQKLSAYGFFKAGGVLVGTHAFAAFANMLGVRWTSGDKTLDVNSPVRPLLSIETPTTPSFALTF